MNIVVNASSKEELLIAIKEEFNRIEEMNQEYTKYQLSQTKEDMIDGIVKLPNNEYMASLYFTEIPTHYVYQGLVSKVKTRKIS